MICNVLAGAPSSLVESDDHVTFNVMYKSNLSLLITAGLACLGVDQQPFFPFDFFVLLVVVAITHPRGIIRSHHQSPSSMLCEIVPQSDNTLDLPKEAVAQSFPPLVTVLSLLAWASIKRQRFFIQSSFPSSFNITPFFITTNTSTCTFYCSFLFFITHSPAGPPIYNYHGSFFSKYLLPSWYTH